MRGTKIGEDVLLAMDEWWRREDKKTLSLIPT